MGEGSSQLVLQAPRKTPLALTFAALGLCAALGFAYGLRRYRKLR